MTTSTTTTTTPPSQSSPLEATLGNMFVPPSSHNINNNNNNNTSTQQAMESHSDTEVELGEHDDNHGGLSPPSSPTRSVSRSMSGEVIVVSKSAAQASHAGACKTWIPPPEPHRAVHRIRLSSLTHNYHQVQAAAGRQKCSVITVVKADGYGHGAIATALHLADYCGADAFAVATLEEGIALRKALAANPPGQWSKQLASHFHTQHVVHDVTDAEILTAPTTAATTTANHGMEASADAALAPQPTMRPAQIRILVLGPPVGFPRCFDDYYHHNIEVMVSGPEVAASLLHWVADDAQRKRTAVERAAKEAKLAALHNLHNTTTTTTTTINHQNVIVVPNATPLCAATTQGTKKVGGESTTVSTESTVTSLESSASGQQQQQQQQHVDSTTATAAMPPKKILPHPSSTLGNVEGVELARELRSLMLHQQEAKMRHQQQTSVAALENITVADSNHATPSCSPRGGTHKTAVTVPAPTTGETKATTTTTLFGGIEAAARSSRQNQAAVARSRAILQEANDDDDRDEIDDDDEDSPVTSIAISAASTTLPSVTNPNNKTTVPAIRKRLRWHALVDSGMGRLGFKTDIVSAHDKTGRQDTVAVLKEMVDLEFNGKAPLEFYGMCTHMADAREMSDFTNSQMTKFKALLNRVRAAGISVPTVSTDNSAALLTTSLKHFDPAEMLTQNGADTRGYVRTGGAIYGQRPAFTQLKAVSTLLASVRHVAILKKGDTVGYDRAYVAPQDVRIATLTIGFADGYPRELGNGVGRVQIRGVTFPVAGNVCMDMMMVDLGPASEKTGTGASVVVGDTAVLWGPLDEDVENGGDNQGMVRLQDIAATLKTTQSALTCGLDKMRVRRHFV